MAELLEAEYGSLENHPHFTGERPGTLRLPRIPRDNDPMPLLKALMQAHEPPRNGGGIELGNSRRGSAGSTQSVR